MLLTDLPAEWTRHVRSGFAVIVRLAAWATVGVFLVESILLLVLNISQLPLLDDIAYGDSYVLYDVLHFQRTGVIYRDLSQPPYLPAEYSPMLYATLALPGRVVAFANPFIGPRLLVLAAFLGCIAIVASLTQTLVRRRYAGLWAVLLACSVTAMWGWVLQIRTDFFGIACSLLTIRLLLSRQRWSATWAGICAGLALQFKISFVAAAVTGVLWLLARFRWRDLALFVSAALVSSVGLYLLWALREPRMLWQITAFAPGIADLGGGLGLLRDACGEAVVLLALVGIAKSSGDTVPPDFGLVLLFVVTAMMFGTLSDVQAGGNVNYYFDALFALVPFAVIGGIFLMSGMATRPVLTLFVTVYFAVVFVMPLVSDLAHDLSQRRVSVQARNAMVSDVQRVLMGRRVFSTVQRVAVMEPAPPLMEPYLLTYLHRLGKVDPTPIVKGVYDGAYDVVVTAATRQEWRGVEHIDPEVRTAITSSYTPTCTVGRWLFHAPKRTNFADTLLHDLDAIGCVPVTAPEHLTW
jgi:hypothetical protein